MSSCMAAAGAGSVLNPSSTAAAATSFAFDHLEIEIFKSHTTSTRKSSPHSSPSSPFLTSSSSPSSTISEASDVLSPHLRLSTRKPRTPRKRPNQTYNEAAVLLSTAYPSIFSTESLLAKPPFKLSKRVEPNWANPNSELGEDDLLLPLSISPKPINVGRRNFETRSTLLGSSSNFTDTNGKQCLSSPVVEQEEDEQEEEDEPRWCQFDQINEEDDATIDAGSILDEETGKGIDSIMGNITANNNNCYSNSSYNYSNYQHQQQKTSNFCYGIPIGLGLGLLGSSNRFNFGFGMARGVRALRKWRGGGGAEDDWWMCPVTTVDVGAISPRLDSKDEQPAPALSSDKKKSKKNKAKVKEEEEDAADKAKVAILAVKAAEAGGGESCSTAAAMGGTENKIKLKLDYDDVLRDWSDKGSMFSEDFGSLELAGGDALSRLAQIDLFGENGGVREASVQRYKEKRRSRLFSKKIRYQIRKANADQRPRMKGRFVRNNSESTGGGRQTQ